MEPSVVGNLSCKLYLKLIDLKIKKRQKSIQKQVKYLKAAKIGIHHLLKVQNMYSITQ